MAQEEVRIVITEQSESSSATPGGGSSGGTVKPFPPAGANGNGGIVVIEAQVAVLNAPNQAVGGGGQNPNKPPQQETPIIAQTTMAFDQASSYVRKFGAAMGDLAKNNAAGVLVKSMDAAASVVEKIPAVGQALGGAMRLASAGAESFNQITNAFLERGREISGYNGQLAVATAMSDYRKQQRDIKEAQQIGGAYAKLQRAKDDLDDESADTMNAIKGFFIEWRANMLRANESEEQSRERRHREWREQQDSAGVGILDAWLKKLDALDMNPPNQAQQALDQMALMKMLQPGFRR